jgi:glycosyltransferase involved in cell wall biosynthesis
MKSPLISVIVPTFNRVHLLGDTLECVISQTYSNWEMIIVDDGSKDPVKELIESYNDPRIRFYPFDHGGNYAVVRNRGLKLCRGELIAFLDSDDTWSPKKLSRLVEVFGTYKSCEFVLSNVNLFGNTMVSSPEFTNRYNDYLFEDLIHERDIVFYPSALAFRKEILNTLSLLNEELPTGADHDFILRMSATFKGAFINEQLTSIRKHDSNTSSRGLVGIYADSIGHVKRFFDAGRLTKRESMHLTAGYYYKLGLILMRQRDKQSSAYFQKSIEARPMKIKAWFRYLQSLFY